MIISAKAGSAVWQLEILIYPLPNNFVDFNFHEEEKPVQRSQSSAHEPKNR